MGNCHRDKLSETNIETRIFEEIKSGSGFRVASIISCFSQGLGMKVLDNLQYKHKNITTNPLGLCLLLNKSEMFSKFINEKSDPERMEQFFALSQFDSIEYLIQKNYLDLLKVYFPIKQGLFEKADSFVDTYSVVLSGSFKFKSKVLPIHLAALRGSVEIVSFFHNYFLPNPAPLEYNIETLEENTGENCGLLACRYGHFELVKFLHSVGCNMKILNHFNENTLIVTLASMNKGPHYKFVNIFKYLLEEVRLDPLYKYEEAAVLAKSRPMYYLLSEHLKKVGVILEVKEFDENSFLYCDPNDVTVREGTQEVFSESFIEKSKHQDNRSALSSIYSNLSENEINVSFYF
jgi:hypothetical protein